MKHAAKDAELYLARCRKLEAQNAALLAALEEIAKPVLGCADGLVEHKMSIARAAITQAKGDTDA